MNWALPSLTGMKLEDTLTVPLIGLEYVYFDNLALLQDYRGKIKIQKMLLNIKYLLRYTNILIGFINNRAELSHDRYIR